MAATHASIAATFADPAASATAMACALAADWGPAALQWHPLAIRMEVHADFGVELPPAQFDRLMAGIATLSSDGFFKSLPEFVVLCGALNGEGYDPAHWDPPSCVDIAWAITEAVFLEHLLLGRDKGDEEPFSEEVRHYIGHACAEEGLTNPPDVLRVGLHDSALQHARNLASWSTEPETYAAIHEAAGEQAAAIKAELKGRLKLLLAQLRRLFGDDLPDLGGDSI